VKRNRTVPPVEDVESNPSSQKTGSHAGAGITDIAVHQDSQDKKRKKKKRKANLPRSSEVLVREHDARARQPQGAQGILPRNVVMHLVEARNFIPNFLRTQGLLLETTICSDSVIMQMFVCVCVCVCVRVYVYFSCNNDLLQF